MKELAWLKKLRCPRCSHAPLTALKAAKKGDWGAWGVPGVRCSKCREGYQVDGGVLRLIPKGDLSRYAYWEDLHRGVQAPAIVAMYKKRFAFSDGFLSIYYATPRVATRLGWAFSDTLELGSGWGSYSLCLWRFGRTRQPWLFDISVTALKGARQVYNAFGLEPFLVQGEIHDLPFVDKAFDGSLSGGLFEHFVGQEQELLVAENCRVAKRVLCQAPESSAAYWFFRAVISAFNGFKWPYGFEVPLSRARFREVFAKAGGRIQAWDFNNLISAVLLRAGDRWKPFRAWTWRPQLWWLLRYDTVVAVETSAAPAKKKARRAR